MSNPSMTYTFRYEQRPWTLNTERAGGNRGQGGRFGRSKFTKEWRAEFAKQAAGLAPFAGPVNVVVLPTTRNNVMADTGACIGAAKAAIDGLVDAGLLPDDGPKVVRRLTFLAPHNTGIDALVLTIEEATK